MATQYLSKRRIPSYHLRLSNLATISDIGLQHIACHLTELQTLKLDECISITDSGLVSIAKRCTKLVAVSLTNNTQISGKNIVVMSDFINFFQIRDAHRLLPIV